MKDSVTIIKGIRSGRKSEGQDARMLGEFLKMFKIKANVSRVYQTNNARKILLESLLQSDSRFLHISAHGDRRGFWIQDKHRTRVTAKHIDDYCRKCSTRTRPHKPLYKQFVTISSCGHVSADFVMKLHESTGVTAVISALAPVGFSDSALFASLFYFSLFNHLQVTKPTRLSEHVALYVDAYQRTKIAYLNIGGTGAHRLDYWWDVQHLIVN